MSSSHHVLLLAENYIYIYYLKLCGLVKDFRFSSMYIVDVVELS